MNSFIPWVGGKGKLLWIINKMAPERYSRFIDVFGGSGTVTMNRPTRHGCMEVYNDFNGNLTNLFCCVKSRTLALLSELGFLPLNTRDDFNVLYKFFSRGEFTDDYLQEEMNLTEVYLKPRFARNTKDALAYVRKLKLLGVGVQFEKEGISTLSMGDEMLLNTFSALAQEESQSISMNQRLSIVKRMELGEYVDSNAPYGYRLVDKMLTVYEPEAGIVRNIFALYLQGFSTSEIARELNKLNIPTKAGKEIWRPSRVAYILKNERYIGDSFYQKTYRETTVPFNQHPNRGQEDRFYAKGTHPGIVEKDVFDAAQTLIEKRKDVFAKATTQNIYPLTSRIFNLYLAGETVDKISKMMQTENCDIPDKTISFSKGMIMNMLSNERYCGDAILQKSVTIDCIEKKRKKNTGEAPMYYVQNNHPAIIDRVTFNKVQEELARRKTKTPGSAKSSITSTGKYSRYALTDVLICGNCGTRYRRVTWSRNGVKRIVWRCISRLDYGKKYCSDSPTIMEDKLQEAIVRAVNKFNEQDNATYKALMRATISEALGLNGDPEEVDMLERKVEALNNKMLALVNESVSSGDGIEAHESEFMTLSQETELLKQRIAAIQESTAKDNGEQSRLEQIQAIISERESKCMEYDDSIVRQMVECIKVYPGGKLEIIFGGGYLVEESV